MLSCSNSIGMSRALSPWMLETLINRVCVCPTLKGGIDGGTNEVPSEALICEIIYFLGGDPQTSGMGPGSNGQTAR